jgi:hypothetical protein
MIPSQLRSLFWDIDLDNFNPQVYPDYTIFRVLEYGNQEAFAWLRNTFPEGEIRRVLCTERRLSRRSANFWALVFEVPFREVAALNAGG